MVTPAGIITTVAGNGYGAGLGIGGYTGDGGPATNAELMYPQSIYVDKSSNLYIADFNNSAVRVVTPVPSNTNHITVADEQFTLYPNPANSVITITASKNIDAVKIYDLTGQLLSEYTRQNGKTALLDVSNFANGLYFITVLSNGKTTTKKAIINK